MLAYVNLVFTRSKSQICKVFASHVFPLSFDLLAIVHEKIAVRKLFLAIDCDLFKNYGKFDRFAGFVDSLDVSPIELIKSFNS